MCTALSCTTRGHYFGRNLDLEYSLGEAVVIAPRRFPLPFRRMGTADTHYAMIGVACIQDGYPLYYDAVNEHGLCAAGLNFPENAYYPPEAKGKDNISPFELIPWLLGRCKTAAEARAQLERIHLAAIPFSDALPLSPLHWMISDKTQSITVEPMRDGLHVIDNPVGVLTNNPPFDWHMTYLTHFMALSPVSPENTCFAGVPFRPYSRGMGALSLPGDLSSASRFVRAAYMKAVSLCGESEEESVAQFFHLLGSVAHVRGSVLVEGRPEITLYTSCCCADSGRYYYTTYENSRITCVALHAENLCGDRLIAYPMRRRPDILPENRA